MKSDPFALKMDTEKPFGGSQSSSRYELRDDFEKKMTDFHQGEVDEQHKDKNRRKEPGFDEEPTFLSKVVAGASKNQEEEKSGKWESLQGRKEEQREAEEPFTERSRKEEHEGPTRSESGHRGFAPPKEFRSDGKQCGPGEKFTVPTKEDL